MSSVLQSETNLIFIWLIIYWQEFTMELTCHKNDILQYYGNKRWTLIDQQLWWTYLSTYLHTYQQQISQLWITYKCEYNNNNFKLEDLIYDHYHHDNSYKQYLACGKKKPNNIWSKLISHFTNHKKNHTPWMNTKNVKK